MSSSYYIYTEVKIKDKWHCINGLIPKFDYDWKEHKYLDKYEYKLGETFYSGSRSYFSETDQKLRELGYASKFSDLSPELQGEYAESLKDENEGIDVWYHPILIDYNDFTKHVSLNKYDMHGMIHKDRIFEWENGDIDEIWAVEHEEFAELTEEEKQAYIYYEWDNPWGWHSHFKDILRRTEPQINAFMDMNYCCDRELNIRLVLIGG